MIAKFRLGCIGLIFLLGLAAILFWRPAYRAMSDWMFEKTTARVVEVLPADEREEALEVCEQFWATIKERGIDAEHAELIKEFRMEALRMMQNNEVTPEEARAFVERVRETMAEIYPDTVPGGG